MAKLSKVDAAKAAGVSRQTLYTYIKDSRLSVDADGLIDTAELLRAGFTLRTLHEIRRQDVEPIGQQLTSRLDALDVYQDMITLLKQQLSEAQAREQAALEREKIARDREALLLHMLQEMHQRTDRLLDIRRTPPPPYAPPARTSPAKPPGALGALLQTQGAVCVNVSSRCSRSIRKASRLRRSETNSACSGPLAIRFWACCAMGWSSGWGAGGMWRQRRQRTIDREGDVHGLV